MGKGALTYEEFCTFLKLMDLVEGYSHFLVLLRPLQYTTLQEFLLWDLAPTVGQSFLWAGSSPADIDGPTAVAIWVNCWIGDDSGDLPTSSTFLTSSLLLSTSPGVGGLYSCMYLQSCLYLHCCRCLLSCLFFWLHCLHLGLCPGFNLPGLHLPSPGVILVHIIYKSLCNSSLSHKGECCYYNRLPLSIWSSLFSSRMCCGHKSLRKL